MPFIIMELAQDWWKIYILLEAPRGFMGYMRVPQRLEGVVFKYAKHIPTV